MNHPSAAAASRASGCEEVHVSLLSTLASRMFHGVVWSRESVRLLVQHPIKHSLWLMPPRAEQRTAGEVNEKNCILPCRAEQLLMFSFLDISTSHSLSLSPPEIVSCLVLLPYAVVTNFGINARRWMLRRSRRLKRKRENRRKNVNHNRNGRTRNAVSLESGADDRSGMSTRDWIGIRIE